MKNKRKYHLMAEQVADPAPRIKALCGVMSRKQRFATAFVPSQRERICMECVRIHEVIERLDPPELKILDVIYSDRDTAWGPKAKGFFES